jgi:hypothetical protein
MKWRVGIAGRGAVGEWSEIQKRDNKVSAGEEDGMGWQ